MTHPSPLRESISLNGLDLTLYEFSSANQGPKGGQGAQGQDSETHVAQVTGEPVDVSEEPLVMDTFHLGFGYSWRLLNGTYNYAINADCRFPRLVLPGPEMTVYSIPGGYSPRCGMDYSGNFYFGAGTEVFQVPSGNGNPGSVFALPSGIAWSMDVFNGNLYLGTSTGRTSHDAPGPLYVCNAGTWNPTGGPNRKAIAHAWYQEQASGTYGAWQLIGSDTTSSVTNCASDPMVAANWGASITVGDTTYGINTLVSTQGHIYVAKINGLHDVDGTTGYTPNLMPFFEAAIDDDNGIAAIEANASIYVNDIAGLVRFNTSNGALSGTIQTVTPGHGLPNESPIRGKITAQTTYGAWVISAVYNGTDTHIMWGRDLRAGDAGDSPFGYGAGYGPAPSAISPSPMMWHGALIYLPNQICRMLAVSALTSPPRLWVGTLNTQTNQAYIQYCILARTENPMQDEEYVFTTNWQVYVPGQDWQHPVTTKDLLEIDVQCDGLGPNTSVDFQIAADDGPYQDFGTANVSPQDSVVGTSDVFGRRLALLMSGTNSSTEPPALRAIMLRAQLRPALRRIRTYDVLLGEGNVDRFGGRHIGRPLTDYQTLEPLQMGGRVTLRDEFGETWQCLLLPPIARKVVYLRGESGRGTMEPTIVATLTLKLLGNPLPVSVSTPPVYWNDGVSRWNDGTSHWSKG